MPTVLRCQGCLIGRIRGQSRCIYCGAAITQGRIPSDREQYDTSEERRRLILSQRTSDIAKARRTYGEIDQEVAAALAAHLEPTAEFEHGQLIQYTGLNPSALLSSLHRLSGRGVVKITGIVYVRSNRTRPKWQYLLPLIDAAAQRDEIAPTTNRITKKSGARTVRQLHPDPVAA
jgi:hypothetical protein